MATIYIIAGPNGAGRRLHRKHFFLSFLVYINS